MNLRTLQARVLAIVLAGSLLFAALAGAIGYRLAYQQAIASAMDTLKELVAAMAPTAAAGAYAGDALLMKEAVGAIGHNRMVARARINGADGSLLADSALAAPHSAPPPDPAVDNALQVAQRLSAPFDPGTAIATLQVQANPEALSDIAQRTALRIALVCVALIGVVGLLLTYAVAYTVSRPIIVLARQLGAMEPGTAQRLELPPAHERDEIGRLARAANALLDNASQALERERTLRAEIERMQEQYRQIFDSTSAGIFVLDTSGKLINGNPTVARVLGMPLDEIRHLEGDAFFSRVFANPAAARQMIADAVARGETVTSDLELRQNDGVHRWVHCLISVYPAAHGGSGVQVGQRLIEGVMYDITERKRAEHEVRRQADHDALTGLKNRRASDAAIQRMVAEALASGGECTLLYIDLDGFKAVNDRHGHEAGDQVLMACAQRMRGIVKRMSDLVGRIGGDEFVVALPHAGPADPQVAQVAGALIEALRVPIVLANGGSVRIGASIGIASCPRHGRQRRALAERADEGLYWVKRHGKNAYAYALRPAEQPAKAEAAGAAVPA